MHIHTKKERKGVIECRVTQRPKEKKTGYRPRVNISTIDTSDKQNKHDEDKTRTSSDWIITNIYSLQIQSKAHIA